jgi:hypothetical protein
MHGRAELNREMVYHQLEMQVRCLVRNKMIEAVYPSGTGIGLQKRIPIIGKQIRTDMMNDWEWAGERMLVAVYASRFLRLILKAIRLFIQYYVPYHA